MEVGRMARYAYEATIKLRIWADGQDDAYRKQREAAERADDGDTTATTSMMSLRHCPELDGSLRVSASSDACTCEHNVEEVEAAGAPWHRRGCPAAGS